MLLGLPAAVELARDADFFIDEEQHSAEEGAREVVIAEFLAQFGHLVVEQLEALDLHLGAREAIDDHAALVDWVEQLVQEQVGDLFVANQAAGVLDLLGAGTVEQVADHDGRCCNAPRFEDEGGIGALACAGRAAEPDDFSGEAELGATEFLL